MNGIEAVMVLTLVILKWRALVLPGQVASCGLVSLVEVGWEVLL